MNRPHYSIHRLTLTDFRNYAALRLNASARMIALVGPNGAGKTNLIEAISLLSPGRGLRGDALSNMARRVTSSQRANSWAVAAEISGPAGGVSLGTSGQLAAGDDDDSENHIRTAMVDGKPAANVGELADYVKMFWVTPAMDRLFAGGPGDRRRFFDRIAALFDPTHGTRVNRFEKLLRERNALLESSGADAQWLASIEAQMAEHAVAVAAGRRTSLDAVGQHFNKAIDGGAFPWGELAIDGEIEELLGSGAAVRVEEVYRKLLHDSRGADRAAGRCLHGPHRSDIRVSHGPKAMPAENCSTGEQKALLLGLVLAQADAIAMLTNEVPLLLLDEVTAHLDQTRRLALFSRLNNLGAQVWMTGTDPLLFDGAGPQAVVYTVENGHVSES